MGKILVLMIYVLCSQQSWGREIDADYNSLADQLDEHLKSRDHQKDVHKKKKKGQKSKEGEDAYIMEGEIDIKASIPHENELKNLEAELSILGNEILDLGNEIHLQKEKFIDQVNKKNFVSIQLKLENPEEYSIRSLFAKLDGYDIYHVDDTSLVWTPKEILPVFIGPMTDGEHRMDFRVSLLEKNKSEIPLEEKTYEIASQSFFMTVADNKPVKNWTVSIKTQKEGQEKVVLELHENGK